jgi:hypothetical protein
MVRDAHPSIEKLNPGVGVKQKMKRFARGVTNHKDRIMPNGKSIRRRANYLLNRYNSEVSRSEVQVSLRATKLLAGTFVLFTQLAALVLKYCLRKNCE